MLFHTLDEYHLIINKTKQDKAKHKRDMIFLQI